MGEHRLLRRKITLLFLLGTSLGSVALIAAITVSPLVAARISGSASWSGLPPAASILGTALGSTLLSRAMPRFGRRPVLIAAYTLAAVGASAAVLATERGSFLLLIAAMLVIGTGHSATPLTRYLNADLYPTERRASAMGWIVWAGTIGAIAGPNLLEPSGRMVARFSLIDLSGAYAVAAILFALAALVYWILLRPDPSQLAKEVEAETEVESVDVTLGGALSQPRIQVGIAAMVVGHVVMVLVMTMTPLHLQSGGRGLDVVGFVASAHVLGMFALAPVTGWLVQRRGEVTIIVAGQLLLLMALLLAALAPSTSVSMLSAALFLLGLGWNFGFLASSGLITKDLPLQARMRLQGSADSAVWLSAAGASVASSLVFGAAGYVTLCVIGAILVLLPMATVLVNHRPLLTKAS